MEKRRTFHLAASNLIIETHSKIKLANTPDSKGTPTVKRRVKSIHNISAQVLSGSSPVLAVEGKRLQKTRDRPDGSYLGIPPRLV
jgi:hypothetical protein